MTTDQQKTNTAFATQLKNFGKLVKHARKAQCLKQAVLGEALGVTGETISKIENGIYPALKYEMFLAICHYLKIPFSEILPT